MALIRAPAHVQRYLDRHYPGMRVEWNVQRGCWVMTDGLWHEDGTPATDEWYGTPTPMRGLVPTKITNRVALFLFEDWSTGERIYPTVDAIVRKLHYGYTGARLSEINRQLDDLEAGEDQLERETDKAIREYSADIAKEAWHDCVGGRSTFGAGARITHWDRRKEDEREAIAASKAINHDIHEAVTSRRFVEKDPMTFRGKK